MKYTVKVIETKNGKVKKVQLTNSDNTIQVFSVSKKGKVFNELNQIVGNLKKPRQRWFENQFLIELL